MRYRAVLAHLASSRSLGKLLLLWVLVAVLGLAGRAQAVDRLSLQRALQSVVLVLVPDANGELLSSGSGTVLDAERGLVLTNFHVLGDLESGEFFNQTGSAVIGVMPETLRGAPLLRYTAHTIAHDRRYDLALLQITGLLDGSTALPKNLGLTAPLRGESDALLPGDRMAVIGYPDLGGATVTYTEGVVSGFLDEENDGEFEWIKTDTQIAPGNSGGLAIDQAGNFIGVPTAGYSRADVASQIGLVRPGAIALRFYDQAILGQETDQEASEPSAATVHNAEFGDAITLQDRVTRPLAVLPSGTTDIYMSFDFAGFRNGQRFAYDWKLDGRSLYSDAVDWREGAHGTTWLHLFLDQGLPDGVYTVEMRLDGLLVHTGTVTVGAAPSTLSASFGRIVFAPSLDGAGQPLDPGTSFFTVDTVYAVFPVAGLTRGTPWRTRWLVDGSEVLADSDVWADSTVRSSWVSIRHPDGLPVGEYTLELYIGNQLAQRGTFTVVERAAANLLQPVRVTGIVSDLNNSRRTVAGALVSVLQPGVSVQQWVDSDFDPALVQASGKSGRNGLYQLDGRLVPGTTYAIVVIHDSYQPLTVDSYTVPATAGDPYSLNLALQPS